MFRAYFSIGSHELQLASNGFGKESIIYDNKIVSEKWNFGLSSTHDFEAVEGDEVAKYNITFNVSLSGLAQYAVKRNDVLVKKGRISAFPYGLLRIYFFIIGLVHAGQLIYFLIFPGFNKSMTSYYGSSQLPWLYIHLGIQFIFGILFLIFALLLKRILVKSTKFITTVLWIYIGLMIINFPPLFTVLMTTKFLYYRFGGIVFIVFRVLLIWVYWSILESCKEMAKELKIQLSLHSDYSSS